MPNKETKYIDADALLAKFKTPNKKDLEKILMEQMSIDYDAEIAVNEILDLVSATLQAINEMPPAPVRKEVHAAWVEEFNEVAVANGSRTVMQRTFTCSGEHGCGKNIGSKTPYCPFCAATMDLDAKGAEG